MVSFTKERAVENKMLWKLFGLTSPISFFGGGGGFMYGKVSSTQKKTDSQESKVNGELKHR
jgi:hypothetical protein